VIQTGEQIVFGVDVEGGTVEAVINIAYSGAAEEFAWILPLTVAPRVIAPGSTSLFAAAAATAPQFRPNIEDRGCGFGFPGGIADAASSFGGDAGAGNPGVRLISEEQVGPYQSVVLEGTDPEAVRLWLVENGYRVTPEMIQVVVPYLATGHVLLALKLRKESAVGDLQPIHLTLDSVEPCIPIKLTAIAAQDDMEITAFVLGARRAIPKNYLHLEPNWLRIDWLNFGRNYRQIMSAAADEAGGNAFTTEYAGASSILDGRIELLGIDQVLLDLRATADLGAMMDVLQFSGLTARPQLRSILQRHVSEELLLANEIDPPSFFTCPQCALAGRIVPFDPAALGDEIEQRIVVPDRAAAQLVSRFPYLTRLYTLISPEEMTLDPMFDFADLPEVSNVHTADVIRTCDGPDVTVEVTVDGTRITLQGVQPPANLPAAALIEDLASGLVVKDNRSQIGEMVGGDQQPGEPLDRRSCACSSGPVRGGWAGALLLGLLLLRRRRR
jgi:MYXO-CTERM domain-containing protein